MTEENIIEEFEVPKDIMKSIIKLNKLYNSCIKLKKENLHCRKIIKAFDRYTIYREQLKEKLNAYIMAIKMDSHYFDNSGKHTFIVSAYTNKVQLKKDE